SVFFQAEDGIRDFHVTGVQTCALPIWERVNPTRLSTGEAIGVGTALMMVVLTAWEHAANLFRERRSLGTLRLLFLDEANRLSKRAEERRVGGAAGAVGEGYVERDERIT